MKQVLFSLFLVMFLISCTPEKIKKLEQEILKDVAPFENLNSNPSGMVKIIISNHDSCDGKFCKQGKSNRTPDYYEISIHLTGKKQDWIHWELYLINKDYSGGDSIKRIGQSTATITDNELVYTERWFIPGYDWKIIIQATNRDRVVHTDLIELECVVVQKKSQFPSEWSVLNLTNKQSRQKCFDPSHGTLTGLNEATGEGFKFYSLMHARSELKKYVDTISSGKKVSYWLKIHERKELEYEYDGKFDEFLQSICVDNFPKTDGWSLIIYPYQLDESDDDHMVIIAPPRVIIN